MASSKMVEVGKVRADDMTVIAAGLKLWIRNAHAAAGTVKGLGDSEGSAHWNERAEDIEDRLLPKFDEQGALALAGAKEDEE